MKLVEEAIPKILDGDLSSFEVIIQVYQTPIIRYVHYLTGGHNDTEDMVQEIFIRVFHNLHKYKRQTSFKNWLYKLAYNHTMNVINRSKIKQLILVSQVPDQIEDSGQVSDQTLYALSRLTLTERNLMYFRVYDDYTFKDLAKIMNKSESSLRKQFERSKKKFIKYYQEEVFLDECEKDPIKSY